MSGARAQVVGLPGAGHWTQRVGAFTEVPRLIAHLGGDPAAALAEAGLAANALAHPENRVPFAACLRLLALAAERTACPHFGLLAGRMWHLCDMGIAGEIARHSSTVGRALEAFTVYQHLNTDAGMTFLLERDGYVDLGYARVAGASIGGAQMHDAVLVACMNAMEELAGPDWRPYEVLLPRAKPRDILQYRALFKITPHFDADQCALRFPAQDMLRPVAGADPAKRLAAEQRAATVVRPLQLLPQVYRALRKLMLENRHSGDEVAHMLGMHRRTLNRRLKERGTTFQEILDEVRFEVARDLLANSDIQLDDVAAALGYAAVTPFMRTFRRWSGTPPGRWRREARAASLLLAA